MATVAKIGQQQLMGLVSLALLLRTVVQIVKVQCVKSEKKSPNYSHKNISNFQTFQIFDEKKPFYK